MALRVHVPIAASPGLLRMQQQRNPQFPPICQPACKLFSCYNSDVKLARREVQSGFFFSVAVPASQGVSLALQSKGLLLPIEKIKSQTRSQSTACLVSLAAVVLAGAKQAFALEDVNVASTGPSLSNPEVMYAIFAIEAIALIGAAVGGTLARQRKEELERLNAQLRKINEYLRSKAMMETYAPGLVYAPVGRPVDDKVLSTERETLKSFLKSGKRFLREKNPQLAYEQFKKALPVAQRIGDPIEEKKAARGLGASCQRQGKFREAIDYHSMVLEISKRTGAADGNAEAFGSIADCYCELGDLEAAQKYYNQYIDKLVTDED